MKNKKAFTLIELVMVVILVGALVSFAVPRYEGVLVGARQKDARVNLELVKSAQNIHSIELGEFYPLAGDGSVTDVAVINQNLKTLLIEDNIDYSCTDTGNPATFLCSAAPLVGVTNWTYSITQADDEPQCAGAGCP